MRLCLDDNGIIVEWVRRKIGNVEDFGACEAMGLTKEDGSPLAGAVYHQFMPTYKTIMISFAAENPKWATHNTVGMFLRYPFAQLGVHKLRAAVAHTNVRSLKLTEGVGFTKEATLRDEFGKGVHAVMFRMLENDFNRLYGNGQGKLQAA